MSRRATRAEAAVRGEAVYGTFLGGDDLYRAELSAGGIIVMGSEGRGISPQAAALVQINIIVAAAVHLGESQLHTDSLLRK